MTELVTKIGRFNADTRTVPVTFTGGEVVHQRSVNAVVDSSGKHDRKATVARVAEVARGVAEKINLGVIVNPPVEEAAGEDDEGAE